MNCQSQNMGSNSCCCAFSGPQLWSKKKKLRVLQQMHENLKEKEKDIIDAIDELKNEK